MKKILFIATAFYFCACEASSDYQQNEKQERLASEAVRQVGMPAITNFQEKRILKNILELRDSQIKTTTYTLDMSGNLHKLCSSVGYGIPAATQFTNPMKTHQYGPIPQADPNGLFSPTSADGTWVLCLNPETKQLSPVYVEPRIIVSPFEMVK